MVVARHLFLRVVLIPVNYKPLVEDVIGIWNYMINKFRNAVVTFGTVH